MLGRVNNVSIKAVPEADTSRRWFGCKIIVLMITDVKPTQWPGIDVYN
jgi:hypothetical protein